MVTVRFAAPADEIFLQQMLAVAADWRPDARVRTTADVLSRPALARYVAGWPRAGDAGVIAEAGTPVGAAWWRRFPPADPGYGFVDEDTPEISIGVRPEHRGQGVGTALLTALVRRARAEDVPALSLSVEPDNPAVALYRRLGFGDVRTSGGSLTMLLRLRA